MATYRLEAINQCLAAIGESPVNSPNSGVPDAASASAMIDRATRKTLMAGWTVNTAFDVKLVPDLEGIIKIASNVLTVDTSGRSAGLAVTTRRDVDGIEKLFKVKDQSFRFDEPVTVDIIYYYDIDDLPFPLQNYIAALAARDFQEDAMGSVALDGFVSRSLNEAWAALLDYEAAQEDSNALRDSPYMRAVTGRNNPISRY